MDPAVAAYRPGCLLVDDREENLFAHEALLQDTGAWICKARSGDEALELLLQHDFAVALIRPVLNRCGTVASTTATGVRNRSAETSTVSRLPRRSSEMVCHDP